MINYEQRLQAARRDPSIREAAQIFGIAATYDDTEYTDFFSDSSAAQERLVNAREYYGLSPEALHEIMREIDPRTGPVGPDQMLTALIHKGTAHLGSLGGHISTLE